MTHAGCKLVLFACCVVLAGLATGTPTFRCQGSVNYSEDSLEARVITEAKC